MPLRSRSFLLDPTQPIIPVDVLLEGPAGSQFVRMALDTGATYTMAPASTLRAIGYDLAHPVKRAPPPQSPVRGLLGLNILRHLNLHLDFPHRALRVT